jgi:1,4-alpha-glucan branching enzyme
MPGDAWQRLANLRVLFAYQWTRPGKKLLFMGSELAPPDEWSHERSLDWHLADDPPRAGLARFLAALGALYRAEPALWRRDPDPDGFRWIDCQDRESSVLCYLRSDGERHVVVILNLTPVPRPGYRVGVPVAGDYAKQLDSDAAAFGGSGWSGPSRVPSEAVSWHGFEHSIVADLPPLSALVFAPVRE